jgi:hypothetical protein
MKNKLLATLLLSFLFVSALQAQKNQGGFIIKGGVNFSNISTADDGSINEANSLTTFNAGVLGDIPIADVLSIQTGLILNGKGAKSEYYVDDNNHNDNYVKAKFKPLYLELPVNAVFKMPLEDKSAVFIGAGPYLALGIGGKSEITTKLLGVENSYEEDIDFDEDDITTDEQEGAQWNKLKQWDMGVNFLAGIEVNHVVLSLNYGLGLTKINSMQTDNDENDKNKYRVFSISLGVKF